MGPLAEAVARSGSANEESTAAEQNAMKANAFNQIMRTNFAAFAKNYMGEPHVAKFIIRHGVGPPDDIVLIKAFLKELVEMKKNERKRQKKEKRYLQIIRLIKNWSNKQGKKHFLCIACQQKEAEK